MLAMARPASVAVCIIDLRASPYRASPVIIDAYRTLYDLRRFMIESRRMDISFNCPHCDQHLAADESGAGMTVNCPSCNERIIFRQES
jgi:DNA-directed RNA polymerase subunit RPC12/RpoP